MKSWEENVVMNMVENHTIVFRNISLVLEEIKGKTVSEIENWDLDWQFCYPVVSREDGKIVGIIMMDSNVEFEIENDIVYEDTIEPCYGKKYFD